MTQFSLPVSRQSLLRNALIIFLGLLLYVLSILLTWHQFSLDGWASSMILPFVIAPILYLLAHICRSIRLALISVLALGISFRSALWIHFIAAPWSFILPFKLDELVRWVLLVDAGRSKARGLVALFIDRSFDGLILVTIFLVFGPELSSTSPFIILPAALSIVVVSSAFILAPTVLTHLQQYLFLNHEGPLGLRLLTLTDWLRRELLMGRQILHRTFPFVLMSTLLIWGLEITAVWALITYWGGFSAANLAACVNTLFSTISNSYYFLSGESMGAITKIVSTLFLLPLVLVWPVAGYHFLRRISLEPKRLGLRVNTRPMNLVTTQPANYGFSS